MEDEAATSRKVTEGEAKESALDKYCVDLNAKASAGDVDPLIGRDQVVSRLSKASS